MADEFNPAFDAALGAFAFVGAGMSHDDLRVAAKLMAALKESDGWQIVERTLREKRTAILDELETLEPYQATRAVYARQAALAQALKWPALLPDVLIELARRKDEEEQKALEQARGAPERS